MKERFPDPEHPVVRTHPVTGKKSLMLGAFATHFTNHHTAKGSTFKDWDAAWRTWVGNAVKFGRSTRDVPTPTRIAPYERAGIIYDDHGVYADWHNATPVSRDGQIIHDPLGRAGTPIVGGAEDLWAEHAAKEAS